MFKRKIRSLVDELEGLARAENRRPLMPEEVAETLRTLLSERDFDEELAIRKYEHRLLLWRETKLEMTKGVILFAQGATRTLLVANGAAAIAMLTFLGGLLNEHSAFVAAVAPALAWFAIGVFFASLVATGSYVTQYMYDRSVGRVSRLGIAAHVFSLVVAAASLSAFILGMIVAYKGLASLTAEGPVAFTFWEAVNQMMP